MTRGAAADGARRLFFALRNCYLNPGEERPGQGGGVGRGVGGSRRKLVWAAVPPERFSCTYLKSSRGKLIGSSKHDLHLKHANVGNIVQCQRLKKYYWIRLYIRVFIYVTFTKSI